MRWGAEEERERNAGAGDADEDLGGTFMPEIPLRGSGVAEIRGTNEFKNR